MKPRTPIAISQRLGTPPTLFMTIDEPMISAAVITPMVSRFAAELSWSPKARSEVISICPRRRPCRAACITRRRSRDEPRDLIAPLVRGGKVGLYGGADSGIPVETVEQMQAALAEGGEAAGASEFVVYPDAPHAFHADYRPSYREAAAQDGWQRLIAWFDEHL